MTTTAVAHAAQALPRHIRMLRHLRRGLPPPRHRVGYQAGLEVPGADGTTLLTDHYFPLADGGFPTLLLRSPYGRGFPWGVHYGLRLAEQGFHVLLQSQRGTGGSSGEFHHWRHTAADGHATVAWLRRQPWFSGRLGTIGPSAMGHAQWMLALDAPPELRAMTTQVGVHDPHDFIFPGGAFSLERVLVNGLIQVHQGRGALRFTRAAVRLQWRFARALRTLPLLDVFPLALGTRVGYIEDWLAHPDADDPYWQGGAGTAADTLAVPTQQITGWHDVGLDQTLRQYTRLRAAGCPAALVVGPWTHTSALEQGWPVVFAELLAWLRAHLCDDRSGLRAAPVRVHVGGCDEWRDLPDWPPPGVAQQRWYPGADGGLRTDEPPAPSGLAPAAVAPSAVAPVAQPPSPVASFRYDPGDPTPAVGGPLLSRRAGARDNTALEARPDVLTFTSAPLTEPVEVIGPVSAGLRVGATGPTVDVFARLCDVDPRGRSRNVCDGLLRLRAAGTEPTDVTVPMSATAHRFAAGHRIRLQVSGGAHPRFARNTGTLEALATTTRLVPVEVTLHPGSALHLPTATTATTATTAGR